MKIIIPIASGKGGVGKTVFTANLGTALASKGKTVVLIDLDLGGSNLHTCLGVMNRHAGIGNYIFKQERNLESLLVETGINRLHFIPGDSLLPGAANLNYFLKKKIIAGIQSLVADFIIIDLASGSSYNTLDFFLISMTGIVVTVPEPTAILNAYSFLKSVLFRFLYRSFPYKSRERETILDYTTKRMEGTNRCFDELIKLLSKENPESGQIAKQCLSSFYPRIVINMGKNIDDLAIGLKLRQIVRRNLNFELEYIGFMYQDQDIQKSVMYRKPVLLWNPQSQYSHSIDQIVVRLLSIPGMNTVDKLFEGDEDINELTNEAKGIGK